MLTIATVSFRSEPFIKYNFESILRLNPGTDFRFLVVNNDPPKFDLDISDSRFRVIDGVPPLQPTPGIDAKGLGSQHHALALNKIPSEVQTRFLLIVDPDFYVLRRDWIREVIAHMEREKLAFFGSPWNPRHYWKYRYFPNIHFMLIDLARVEKETLDFAPEFEHAVKTKARILEYRLLKYFRKHLMVGTGRDTAYKIYRAYHSSPAHKHECLIPVLTHPMMLQAEDDNRFPPAIRRWVPEWLSLLPTDADTFTEKSFLESDFKDLYDDEWEEFLWRGEPFGVHLRRVGRRKFAPGPEDELTSLAGVFKKFSVDVTVAP